MKNSAIIKFVIKILRAVLYVLSAGHICACEHKHTENDGESENE